jgi:hypothetical protein
MRTTSYLSLLNAMIEAMYWVVAQRKRYEVQQAELVPPNVFVSSDRTALVAELRLGWPALDGKIVLESDGNTAAYAALMIHSTSFGLPAFFELDPETLGLIDQLHERAGMFAWRDTYCDMLGWDDAHMEWAVARAIDSMEVSMANLADRSRCAGCFSLCGANALPLAEYFPEHGPQILALVRQRSIRCFSTSRAIVRR